MPSLKQFIVLFNWEITLYKKKVKKQTSAANQKYNKTNTQMEKSKRHTNRNMQLHWADNNQHFGSLERFELSIEQHIWKNGLESESYIDVNVK